MRQGFFGSAAVILLTLAAAAQPRDPVVREGAARNVPEHDLGA